LSVINALAMRSTLRAVCELAAAREGALQAAMKRLLAPPEAGTPKLTDAEIAKLECELASLLGAAKVLQQLRRELEALIPKDDLVS
jgi:hypothetical protein